MKPKTKTYVDYLAESLHGDYAKANRLIQQSRNPILGWEAWKKSQVKKPRVQIKITK